MEIVWDNLTDREWEALAGPALPMQQAPAYGTAMAALGARVRRGVIASGGRAVALAQVLERPGLRVILRGPVWLTDDAGMRRPVLRRLARHAGATVVTPEVRVAGPGLIPLVTPVHHALWRLDGGTDLRAGLSPKWRNRLRAAERAGVAPMRATSDGKAAARVLDGAAACARARGFRALPPVFFAAWQGERSVWVWHHQGRVAAGMVFLRHGLWATYHAGWASAPARAVFAHGPMLMAAAAAFAAEGVITLDLGTVCDETAPGLAHFKRGTGAGVTALGPTCWVLP